MANIKRRGNSYSIRVSAGYDTTGKQIVKSMTWKIPTGMSDKKAEKEANHVAALFEEQVRTGQTAERKIKFADFADKWFSDYADTQLRPKTIARAKGLMERIIPALGHIYLDKIRASENIELVTSSVIDEIRGGAAGMSSAAVRNVQTGETRVIEAEGIFVYVGMAPVSGFLPEAVTRDAAGFIVTDAEMCTSVPGIFAAGDIRAKRCRQVSSAVGDGATAATAALSYLEHLNA